MSKNDVERATKWNRENKDRRKIILDKYYKKHKERDGERQRFGTYRKNIFERDKYICQRCLQCFTKDKLVVHHKDGNGRNSKKINNDLSNLQTLCKSCHIKLHHKGIKNPKKKNNVSRKSCDFCFRRHLKCVHVLLDIK